VGGVLGGGSVVPLSLVPRPLVPEDEAPPTAESGGITMQAS